VRVAPTAVVLTGPVEEQVRRAVDMFAERGLLHPAATPDVGSVPLATHADRAPTAGTRTPLHGESAAPSPGGVTAAVVAVLIEPGRERLTRQLLGGAARLAHELGGWVVAVGPVPLDPAPLGRWGSDEVVEVRGAEAEEDVATAVTGWVTDARPVVVLAGGTAWGREVASRVAAATGSGLTGDAVGLGVDQGRLVAWKPAFGGSLVAAITASSPLQMATVRPGVLPMLEPRPAPVPPVTTVTVEPRRRAVAHQRIREDDLDVLAEADTVIGVGQGVDPAHYGELEGLRRLLGAELAATRKVTDNGWMPRARQVGITGHSIAPRLYVAVAASGKFNHTVGFRSAGFVVAVNAQPDAPVFAAADLGLVGDWREIVPALEAALAAALSAPAGAL
jgi:electron transfer flavoprotein alpha subunit